MSVRIVCGDMLAELPKLATRFHAVVTDPPYHLNSIVKRFGQPNSAPVKVKKMDGQGGSPHARATRGFMGKQWDGGDIAFRPETWALIASVMLPGAHLVAFAGTKGAHRMACAIEDAGFEIRDTLAWLYGSGFPKSHNQKGEWEGWGTALKPAYEPIVLARWPMAEKTVAGNLAEHRCGAINIDGCRIDSEPREIGNYESTGRQGCITHTGVAGHAGRERGSRIETAGRWPANVVHDGSAEVMAAFPDTGISSGGAGAASQDFTSKNGIYGKFGKQQRANAGGLGDIGSAARFFYSAKADAADRLGSKHPTVKPVDLMRWLVRLVTPKGGRVLDPFAGSGTTGMACMAEGFDCTLIEREAEYVADIERRLAHVTGADAPLLRTAASDAGKDRDHIAGTP